MSMWTGCLALYKCHARTPRKVIDEHSDLQAGYTLIETLIAFVILAMSTAGFYQAWSISAQALHRGGLKHDALTLTSSLFERIGTPDLPLQLGEYTAAPEEDQYWRIVIRPYNENARTRLQLMSVDISVFSDGLDGPELVHIRSLRLGSRTP